MPAQIIIISAKSQEKIAPEGAIFFVEHGA
jgi:hypothetical protein